MPCSMASDLEVHCLVSSLLQVVPTIDFNGNN